MCSATQRGRHAIADHDLLAGTAQRRAARVGANRSPRRIHGRHALHRRRPLRLRSLGHHRLRPSPRRAAGRHRQLPDDPRHLSRSTERIRVRHQPGRHRIRRPGDQRRTGRRRAWLRSKAVRRLGWRLQHQLGRRMDRAREDRRTRLVSRVRDSVPHAALSVRHGADVGHQFPAQHPPSQRARLLGADSAAVQSVSAVAGRLDRRRADSGAAQLPHHALRDSATRWHRAKRPSTPRQISTSAST